MKWPLLFLLLLPAAVPAQQQLSLEQAVELGKAGNRSLQIAELGAQAEASHAAAVGAERLPSLSVLGSYTRLEDGSFRLTTTNSQQPIPVGDVVVDNIVLRLGLRQPLFTGFRLSSLSDAADFSAEAARGDRMMAEEDVVYGITSAYWALYQTRKLTELSGENVKRTGQYLQDTDRLLEAGLATRNDKLRVEVQLSRAKITLLESENAARIAEMRFNVAIGWPAATKVELTSSPVSYIVTGRLEPAGSLVDSAVRARPDIQAASLRTQAAGEMVRAAESAWWPQFELTANYQYNNPNARYQPITPEFLGTWDVGVTMLFDIWNWGRTGSRVEQAEAAQKSADLKREELKETIVVEVQSAVLNMERARGKLDVAELAVDAADENMRTLSEKYGTGLATSTEILDAEIDLFRSQAELSAAQIEFAVARAEVRRAMGGAAPQGILQ